MLASNPASILNHIHPRSGIPFDSLKTGNALEERSFGYALDDDAGES